MSLRMRVLISAYACEPHQGSEPEVGWQWALQMARFHEVTVLTQSKNQATIERELESIGGAQPHPQFVYHALPRWLFRIRRFSVGFKTYYVLWQRSARGVVTRLNRERRFDLMHHITFAAYRYPIAIHGNGVPVLWGPVGGMESIPWRLLPWGHPTSLAHELVRNAHNRFQTMPFHSLPRRARAASLILASTREMQAALARLGFEAEVMPTIGLKTAKLPCRPHRPGDGPLKLLYVGNLITLKGIDLALHALKQSGTTATFALVGSGNYSEPLRRLASELGLQDRVTFLGRLPMARVLEIYPEYDVFVFPSLHDTGGYAVIEAMFNELPVVCLDCGGPAVAVQTGCGVRVPVGSRAQVITELASAFRSYDQNRALMLQHGQAARQAVLRNYDWDRKGEQMNECYLRTVNGPKQSRRSPNGLSPAGS